MFRRTLVLVALASCGPYERLPNGEVAVTALDHDEITAAENATRDVPCERGKVIVVAGASFHGSSNHLVVVEGCGQRLSYICNARSDRCDLFARLQR
jgi:hypothetical protein